MPIPAPTLSQHPRKSLSLLRLEDLKGESLLRGVILSQQVRIVSVVAVRDDAVTLFEDLAEDTA